MVDALIWSSSSNRDYVMGAEAHQLLYFASRTQVVLQIIERVSMLKSLSVFIAFCSVVASLKYLHGEN